MRDTTWETREVKVLRLLFSLVVAAAFTGIMLLVAVTIQRAWCVSTWYLFGTFMCGYVAHDLYHYFNWRDEERTKE